MLRLLNSCPLITSACTCWEPIVNNGVAIEIGVIPNITPAAMDVPASKIFFDLLFARAFWFILFL
ncbi:hypothetical protein FJB55_002424 [Enterococcus faecium]|nr:hypothetical protein [Enterococcus faecium]